MIDKEQDDLDNNKLLLEELRLQYQQINNIKNNLEGKANNLLALISIIQGIISATLSLSLVKLEILLFKEIMGIILGLQILSTIIAISFYIKVVYIKKYDSPLPDTKESNNSTSNNKIQNEPLKKNISMIKFFIDRYDDVINHNESLNEKKATNIQLMLIFFVINVICLSLFIGYILINIVDPNIFKYFLMIINKYI